MDNVSHLRNKQPIWRSVNLNNKKYILGLLIWL